MCGMSRQLMAFQCLVHPDSCAKTLLHWFDGMLEADVEHHKANGGPFSVLTCWIYRRSTMRKMLPFVQSISHTWPRNVILEMEIGTTGGVEDGVDKSGVSSDELYPNPGNTWMVHERISPIPLMMLLRCAIVSSFLVDLFWPFISNSVISSRQKQRFDGLDFLVSMITPMHA